MGSPEQVRFRGIRMKRPGDAVLRRGRAAARSTRRDRHLSVRCLRSGGSWLLDLAEVPRPRGSSCGCWWENSPPCRPPYGRPWSANSSREYDRVQFPSSILSPVCRACSVNGCPSTRRRRTIRDRRKCTHRRSRRARAQRRRSRRAATHRVRSRISRVRLGQGGGGVPLSLPFRPRPREGIICRAAAGLVERRGVGRCPRPQPEPEG
jgi:hypothetical protein